MGRSYNKAHKATNVQAPKQWTDVTEHKYCKQVDLGREGKPNKAQKCDQCLAIKAQQEKLTQMDTSARRQEKMGWGYGEVEDW
ncbi:hypothetical protein V8F06_005228 [Rhypophila decipiens]